MPFNTQAVDQALGTPSPSPSAGTPPPPRFNTDAVDQALQTPSPAPPSPVASSPPVAASPTEAPASRFNTAAVDQALATPTPQQSPPPKAPESGNVFTTPPPFLGKASDIDPSNPLGSLASLWDKAAHRVAGAIAGPLGGAWNEYQAMQRPLNALTGFQSHPARDHLAATALEKIGDAFMVTPSWLGAGLSDIDPKNPLGSLANTANATLNPLVAPQPGVHERDFGRRLSQGDLVGLTDEYFPTSAAELKRLDEAGTPVLSSVAHQMRNHPILTGLGTTAALYYSPSAEGALLKALAGGAAAAAPRVWRGAQSGARAATNRVAPFVARRIAASPERVRHIAGRAGGLAQRFADKAGKYATAAGETYQRHFGSPARRLYQAVPNNPYHRAVAENQGMRYLGAPRRAMAQAQMLTEYAFNPTHTADIGMGVKQRVGSGSSSEERELAVDHYEARENALEFERAPEPIRKAASAMNQSWEKYKADPKNTKEIVDANMGEVPRDAQNVPIWDAMDVSFAPEHFIERESNAKGIHYTDHGKVYAAARNEFFARLDPERTDLSRLDVKAGVRVARMSHAIRHVVNKTQDRLKRTDPRLLPTERTGYFTHRNVLEDLPDPDEQGVAPANRRGRAVRLPYTQHAKYGTIAQMRKAFPGRKIWGGLSPEDALRDDLQRKWTNIYATNAFNTLGGMTDRASNRIHDEEIYTDPQTGERVDHAEAVRRAREDIINLSLYGAAAHRRDTLDPRTGLPEQFPKRIPNEDAAKERVIQAKAEVKRGEKLQDRIGVAGTRSVDAAVNSALQQEDATDRLAGKMDANAEKIKGAQYEQTEATRKAFEAGKGKTKEAKAAAKKIVSEMSGPGEAANAEGKSLKSLVEEAKQRIAEHQDELNHGKVKSARRAWLNNFIYVDESFVEKNEQRVALEEAKKTPDTLGRAFYRIQNQIKRRVGVSTEKNRKVISGRTVKMTSDLQKYRQRMRVLHEYSIDASQVERKHLESIARKHMISSRERFNRAVARYYIGAYDQARKKQFLQLARNLRAEMSADSPAVADRVENQFRLQDPHYINGTALAKAGINIPGVGPDTRISKDAFAFFTENQVPAQEANDFSRVMQSLDTFGRMGVVYDPIIHGVFNLGMTYIGRTRDVAGLAAALPMLLATMAGGDGAFKAWEAANARDIELMQYENAWQPGGFSEQLPYFMPREEERDPTGIIRRYKPAKDASQNYSAMRRSVSRSEELPTEQKIMKLFDSFAEWNSHVVFDRFEKWYATKIFQHETKRLGSTALAARSVRDAMGTDLITPFEHKLMNHPLGFWFYPWFKTIVRFAIATGIHDPMWWDAPVQGFRVQRENEGFKKGRVGSNPYTFVTKHPGGGFDRHTVLLPQRILNALASIVESPADERDQSIGRFSPLLDTMESHLKPASSVLVGLLNEISSYGKSPKYTQPLAPDDPLVQMPLDLAKNYLGKYLSPIKDAATRIQNTERNPAGALSEALQWVTQSKESYAMPGDEIGGPRKHSPYDRFNKKRYEYQLKMRAYAPGARHENAHKYRRELHKLNLLYGRYPMMKP